MRPYLPALFAVLVLAAGPALAETIRVVGEDGSVQELDLSAPPAPASEAAPAPEPEAAPAAPSVQATPTVTFSIEKESAAPEESAKEGPAKPKVVIKGQTIKSKTKTKTKAKPKAAKKVVETPIAPPVYKPTPRVIPPGTVITRELAIQIAVDAVSFPSRSIDAFPRTYQGKKVFVVVFKTDRGLSKDVLVDGTTGAIIPTY